MTRTSTWTRRCSTAALSPDHAGGLPANLKYMQQVAFHLRERMSTDNWRILNNILQELPKREEQDVSAALEWLDGLITQLMTLSGFALDGMTRDTAWRFMSIGRRMERLLFQCAAVQCAFLYDGSAGLSWLLRLSDSIVTYRARYMTSPEWLPVLDLVVLDASNPRSVLFSARGVLQYLEVLEEQLRPLRRRPVPRARELPRKHGPRRASLARQQGPARCHQRPARRRHGTERPPHPAFLQRGPRQRLGHAAARLMSEPRPIRYRVVHETVYQYSSQVNSSRQIAHLTPRDTPLAAAGLAPAHRQARRQRAQRQASTTSATRLVSFFVEEPHTELIVRAESEVVVASQAHQHRRRSPPWEEAVVERGPGAPALDLEPEQYRVPSPNMPLLAQGPRLCRAQLRARPPLARCTAGPHPAHQARNSSTTPRPPPWTPACAEVLERKRGVCQDYAHLMLSCLRGAGHPRRAM